MDPVLRGLAVFLTLLVIFRVSGKRTLHETTTFDFVLLLIIAEVVQQAMIKSDYSFTNALILICTLVGVNVLFSLIKQRSKLFLKLTEGTPVVVVENGKLHHDRMEKERVDEDDVLTAARELHGLEQMADVKHAVLERDGAISVVPASKPRH
jgi:uncharacterized membrane protein YcaP (DUF421 family)